MAEDERRPTSEELVRQARERYSKPSDHDDLDPSQPSDTAVESAEAVGKDDQSSRYDEESDPVVLERQSRAGDPMFTETTHRAPVEPPPLDEAERSGGTTGLFRRISIAMVVFGAIALGGLVYDFFTEAKRDDSGAVIGAGEVAAADIQVGDCLLLPEGTSSSGDFEFESLEAVPCTDPHDVEVYASFAHVGTSYPGEDALFEFADELCLPEFERFTGISFEHEARLVFISIVPDPIGWSEGERTVECLIQSYDGAQLVGTQENNGLLGLPGLEVGLCYDVAETATYDSFTEVTCDQPHDLEYYAATELSHGKAEVFPGDDWLGGFAAQSCGEHYENFVGRPWEFAISPDYVWGYPTGETWSFGDRLVQCFLVDPDGGSLDGSQAVDA